MHLDGFDPSNLLTTLECTANRNNGVKSARHLHDYSDDEGMLVGRREGDYEHVFCEQRSPGTMQVWPEPFTTLRSCSQSSRRARSRAEAAHAGPRACTRLGAQDFEHLLGASDDR